MVGEAGNVDDHEHVAGTWQAARTLGDYSLVGCSVGPGFEFADFRFVSELADHTDHFTAVMQHLRELL